MKGRGGGGGDREASDREIEGGPPSQLNEVRKRTADGGGGCCLSCVEGK